ncbi:sigma-54-dependent transcriptional regulator [Noviherbaspirillum malthae]|jgi:DNA-binding NtrC family response regulator|uniref:sigma-54-dependent transcriptional regulator n=1 Tax=Noviherbaspirillum malthae TaxID=1260987 RepID=UPI0018902DF2|nr:sigma-54 dependent transcriptional regulator [Noviherbaspirillum malthae]
MNPAILIIEDHQVLARNIMTYLKRHGYETMIAPTGELGIAQLASFAPDVILLDYHLPESNGMQVLMDIRKHRSNVKIIMLTGHGNVEIAVEAMKCGADDYLSKPVALSELRIAIEKALKLERTERKLSYLLNKEAESGAMAKIVGESAPMLALKDLMRRLINAECMLTDNDLPAVLITGETGTGKELLARALHFEGPRKEQAFVELNCASFPPHLLEAELFGYERGAFTDAQQSKQGLIEAADGGTLFLDEVAELELAAQAKLLKILEDKKVRRLGSVRDKLINFRIIAATNQNIERYVQEGRFRSDLYYRLRTVQMTLPPLRERGGDILLLAKLFLASHGKRYGKTDLRFTPAAEQAILEWHWPGNVREMRNLMEQAALLTSNGIVQAQELGLWKAPATSEAATAGECLASNGDLNMERMERDFLREALRKTNWNVTQASVLLGLSRDTLRYRMEKYGLKNLTS